MKKVIIVFSLVFFYAVYMEAQVVKSIAVTPGIVWANQEWEWLNIQSQTEYNYKTGLHLGVNTEFLQHKYISILAEAGYVEKGMRQTFELTNPDSPEGTGETKTFKTTFKYAYISPMLKARFELGNIVPYIFIGPRADFYLSYKSDLNYDELKDKLNKTVFGMIYGLGIEYMFGPLGIALIYSQQLDFMPALENEPPHGFGLEKITNNAFILDLGIKYYFVKK